MRSTSAVDIMIQAISPACSHEFVSACCPTIRPFHTAILPTFGLIYLVPNVEIFCERVTTRCVGPIVWHQWDIVEMIGVDCRHCGVVFRSFPILSCEANVEDIEKFSMVEVELTFVK